MDPNKLYVANVPADTTQELFGVTSPPAHRDVRAV